MPVTFPCPACQQMISAAVPAETPVQCPLCHQRVTVPDVAPLPQSPPSPEGPASGDEAPVLMPYSHRIVQPQNHGMAVASLVFGILGLVGCQLLGIPGVILGWIALKRVNRDPIQYGGRGMAIGGLCTGGVSLVLLFAISLMFYPLIKTGFQQQRESTNRLDCQLNIVAISDALFFYAQDGGEFPPNLDMLVDRGELDSTVLNCPSDMPDSVSYFYVPGYELLSDPNQIILYENPNIHWGEGGHILTVDNTIEFVDSPEFEERIGAITLPDGTPYAPHDD